MTAKVNSDNGVYTLMRNGKSISPTFPTIDDMDEWADANGIEYDMLNFDIDIFANIEMFNPKNLYK